jgi:hypothetical protein
MPVRLQGDKATIIQHSSAFGILRTEVRKFEVYEPRPYAQHPVSVSVSFAKPRERKIYGYRMVEDGERYLTIERDGQVLYDSRTDVPIDMAKWTAVYEENKQFHRREG